MCDGVVLGRPASEFFAHSVPLFPLHEGRTRVKQSYFRVCLRELGAVNGKVT